MVRKINDETTKMIKTGLIHCSNNKSCSFPDGGCPYRSKCLYGYPDIYNDALILIETLERRVARQRTLLDAMGVTIPEED